MERQSTIFVFIFAAAFHCTSCKSQSSAPVTSNDFHFEIGMTIVRYDSLGTVGGPGFYCKPIIRNLQFDPRWGDSVVKALLDSNILLTEFLYPAELGKCHDPFMGALEIAKLDQPDTAIYRFGHVPLDSVATFLCIDHWRRYKIVRVAGGD